MCGIAALIAPPAKSQELEPHLARMLDLANHRGPDGRGQVAADGIALGHLRLAIIDLSADAHQPMHWQNRIGSGLKRLAPNPKFLGRNTSARSTQPMRSPGNS